LVAVLERHVLPLYRTALGQLESMCAGTAESCYYWERADDRDDRPAETEPETV
jgi:hypothetical protein